MVAKELFGYYAVAWRLWPVHRRHLLENNDKKKSEEPTPAPKVKVGVWSWTVESDGAGLGVGVAEGRT